MSAGKKDINKYHIKNKIISMVTNEPANAKRTPSADDKGRIEYHTIDVNNPSTRSTPTTSIGIMTFTSREDDIKRKTTKFIMENKTIFEELSKL
jgi:hypothetical protein